MNPPEAWKVVEQWVKQLVDLGGRNRMLYYKDLTRGTLRLDEVDPGVVASLLQGEAIPLPALRLADMEDARRRLRAIHDKAQENLEENGIRTLFLAAGLATWVTARPRKPCAPVILWPLEILHGGAIGDPELRVAGDPEVNPALELAMEVDFGRAVTDPEELVGAGDLERVGAALNTVAADLGSVPGFGLDPAPLIIGNFSYEKFPMVEDLAAQAGVLLTHPLVAAIAGDKSAQTSLLTRRPDKAAVDAARAGLEDLLVLEADPTQRTILARISSGESLVVEGPPGTGKSQTIANLVALEAARGRSVLFVAEKRAAVDAVTRRLEAAGLAALVMDLHGVSLSRRRLAEHLGEAVEAAERSLEEAPKAQAERVRSREAGRRLEQHAAALHRTNSLHGCSVFDLLEDLAELGPGPSVSLSGEVGDRLTLPERDRLVSLAVDWAVRGGPGASLWSAYPDSESAVAAADNARRARQALAALMTALDSLAAPVEPGNLRLARLERACRGAVEARSLVESHDRGILQLDAAQTLADLRYGGREAFARARRLLASMRLERAQAGAPEEDLERLAAFQDAVEQLGVAPDSAAVDTLAEASDSVRAISQELLRLRGVVEPGAADLPLSQLLARLEALQASRPVAASLSAIRGIEAELRRVGLGHLLRALPRLAPDTESAEGVARRTLDLALLDAMVRETPPLQDFDAAALSTAVARFRQTEADRRTSAPERVKGAVLERVRRVLADHSGQRQAVLGEAAKARRHAAIREIFGRAPDVLTAVRPCWTMSPLMVSQLLPPLVGLFDLVVFDEASQVLPADAIPSIYRGRQVVVAGDRKQLPPTTFFMSGYGEDTVTTDEDLGLAADYQSILDLAYGLLPTAALGWHYRSQDHRLIAYSNAQFYRGGLLTFPGVGVRSAIRHVLVTDPAPKDRTFSNPHEVERIVGLVLEHARTYPQESLGVVAMGLEHAEEIKVALEARLRTTEDPEVRAVLEGVGPDRFFIKNLEQVQGDERDAMILSLGYAPTADGRLRHHFGPLNQTGGERRLNVAVTRARRRMTVVSSFRAADLDLRRSPGAGVKALKAYLEYVEADGNAAAAPVGTDAGALVGLIARLLREGGVPAHEMAGVAGSPVDVAICDPGDPDRFSVALVLDGRFHASLPTAGDRDHLRAEVLERMGWRVLPTWALAWQRDPDAEVARLLAQIAPNQG